MPNDLRYHYSDRKRERTNGQLAVQFKPVDTLMLTTDYTYAENHLQENRGDQTLWFVRKASAVTFDTNQAVATPAMISEATGIGKDHGFEQQYPRPDEHAAFGGLQHGLEGHGQIRPRLRLSRFDDEEPALRRYWRHRADRQHGRPGQ